jgi:hypothetical protein
MENIMSTRGAFGFVLNGELRLTYNHSDSYPASLGEEVMDFCRHIDKQGLWSSLKERVAGLRLVKDNDKVPVDVLSTKKAKGIIRKSNISENPTWYEYMRPYQGAETLWKISKGEVEQMIEANDFPKDSLSCEFVYVIDLDKMVLGVYKGRQTEPDADCPFGYEPYAPFPDSRPDKVFYPCKQVGAFFLNSLPVGTAWQVSVKNPTS